MTPRLLLVFALCSCGSSAEPPASLGDLRYAAPPSWQQHDINDRERLIARWVPDDNVNKESISVIRTQLRPTLKSAQAPAFESLLAEAQKTLPNGHVSAPTMLRTSKGLSAIRIDADFVPAGLRASYHRVHAIVVDGSALVHVMYTAKTPDPDLKIFHLVLDTIHREEG